MLFLKQNASPTAIKASGVALRNNSEIPYELEIGEIKKVCKANIGLNPINEKMIDPVIKVNTIAIIGAQYDITNDGWPLEIILGK